MTFEEFTEIKHRIKHGNPNAVYTGTALSLFLEKVEKLIKVSGQYWGVGEPSEDGSYLIIIKTSNGEIKLNPCIVSYNREMKRFETWVDLGGVLIKYSLEEVIAWHKIENFTNLIDE